MTRKTQVKKWNFPKWLFVFFLVFILYLYGHLVYISLFNNVYGIDMKALAASRDTVKTVLAAKRGGIYDTKGSPLAITVNTYRLVAYLSPTRTVNEANPKHVVDKEYTATKLSEILGGDYEYYLKQLNQNLYQTYFGNYGNNITEITKDSILELGLPGIDFEEDTSRSYPNGDFASYIIGYTQKSSQTYTNGDYQESLTTITGELGVELEYNDILSGKNGYLEYQRTRTGYKIPDTPEIRTDAEDGSNIYLTIDSSIQRFVESAIGELKGYNPEWATITVMSAKTGDILASSSIPSFDPNIRNITNYENPLVTYTYEPGSTMKIFSFLCAIDNGVYKGDDTYLSGKLTVGEDTISDWNEYGFGTITYDVGFRYSSNVAAANLVQNYLGKEKYYDCLMNYGYGVKTGISLPREQNGKIAFTYPIEVVTASYGQGITTTPIQNLQALTIISNNGKMLKPHIISKIVDSKGNVTYERQIEESEQKVSAESVKKIRELMYDVVNSDDPWSTGLYYKNSNVEVMGKTGTAQYTLSNGEYSSGTNNFIYSFAGMFPYDDPQYIIYASVKRPEYGASWSVSQLVNSTINSIVKYKDMDEIKVDTTTNSITLPSYLNRDIKQVNEELAAFKANVVTIGDGNKVINQYPSIGTEIVVGDKVFLITNLNNISVVNINNWSKEDVSTYANLIGYTTEFEGYGFVTEYKVEDKKIIAKFSEKYEVGE